MSVVPTTGPHAIANWRVFSYLGNVVTADSGGVTSTIVHDSFPDTASVFPAWSVATERHWYVSHSCPRGRERPGRRGRADEPVRPTGGSGIVLDRVRCDVRHAYVRSPRHQERAPVFVLAQRIHMGAWPDCVDHRPRIVGRRLGFLVP